VTTERILITGSRDYADAALVKSSTEELARQAKTRGVQLIIVHGGCPTGADNFAALAVQSLIRQGYDLVEEVHAVTGAEWDRIGPGAGPRRNTKMVSLGASLCLAFWDGVSKGTLDTISKAVKAAIPVILPTSRLMLQLVLPHP
jgi:hypothetical protein